MIIPTLRFKADDGSKFPELERKQLKDFAQRITRKNRNNETSFPLTISAQDGLVNQEDYFHKKIASRDMSGYYLLYQGDFAYNKSYSQGFPVGSIKRLDKYKSGAVSTLYLCFSINTDIVNSNFMTQFFSSNKWHDEIHKNVSEGARNHGLLAISAEDFFSSVFILPTKQEQQKISDFLSIVDDKITIKQQKVDALEQAKKGFIQQVFSQQIRFKTDDDTEFPDWGKRKVSVVFSERKEKKHPNEEPLTIIQGQGTIKRSESTRRIAFNSKNLVNYKYVKENDFIIHLRTFEGGLEKANSDGIVSPAYRILYSDIITPEFYKVYFRSYSFIHRPLSECVVGLRDGKNIDMETFWNIRIPYPVIEEQQKIADFLSKFDEKIAVERESLVAWQTIKKGLLQQMFASAEE